MSYLTELLEREYELRRELEARQCQSYRYTWLLAWAQMMHNVSHERYFGNGLWFGPGFEPAVMEVPPHV